MATKCLVVQDSPVPVQLVGVATAVLQDGYLQLHLAVRLRGQLIGKEVEPALVVSHLFQASEWGQLDHVADRSVREVVPLAEDLELCRNAVELRLQTFALLVGRDQGPGELDGRLVFVQLAHVLVDTVLDHLVQEA